MTRICLASKSISCIFIAVNSLTLRPQEYNNSKITLSLNPLLEESVDSIIEFMSSTFNTSGRFFYSLALSICLLGSSSMKFDLRRKENKALRLLNFLAML